jgi:hypothetical protein
VREINAQVSVGRRQLTIALTGDTDPSFKDCVL